MFTIAKSQKKSNKYVTYPEVVQKIFNESELTDICLNKRIVKCVRKRIQSLLNQGLSVHKKGSKQIEQFLKKMKKFDAYHLTIDI